MIIMIVSMVMMMEGVSPISHPKLVHSPQLEHASTPAALPSRSAWPVEMARIVETAYDVVAATLELVERLKGLRRG